MNNYFNITPESPNVDYPDCSDPSPQQIMEWTLMRFFDIGGIRYDQSEPALITKHRIRGITQHIIFNSSEPLHPFSADGLVAITAYIDAMPKPLGYTHPAVLKRESTFLIPSPINSKFDAGEYLQPFLILRNNFNYFNCNLIKIGLFLLLFDHCDANDRVVVRWDKVVDSIMLFPQVILSLNINKI